MKLCPVILAGGGGTRLWPLSREHYPKQFLTLFDNNTLLQNTLLRLDGLAADIDVVDPVIICNEAHRFLVAEQSAQVSKNVSRIILEPKGRNTAPALTVASLNENDAIIIMMPADHIITKSALFHEAISAGIEMAKNDFLVTFGIKPNAPETGYGYIHMANEIRSINGQVIHEISGFTEKPEQSIAEAYLSSGDYLWNSGIFMMKASVWLEKVMQLQLSIYDSCVDAYNKGKADGLFFRLDEASFLNSPDDSIDYAVMEKLAENNDDHLAVIPVDVGWSDVGAWSSVWDINDKDKNNNHIEGDVITDQTKNCLIRSERGLIVTIGCEDMVIVDTDDAIMIADKNKTQDVKKIVEKLKNENRSESLTHRKVYRPWGSYDSIDMGDSFQAKRLIVNPGKKLSLQSHAKRAEHWVVVKGVATVTKGEEKFLLNENESTYIPLGVKHRLENAGDKPLEIIEVQSGSYLGEDDIVRYDDDFGRE
ncbi:MAG: mannose-1-phosphate guanylyltransferase/mannose-6-phosphate isomerase [Proteobacteria bacterium]|nr:mannose-1-phosphate guanylyltransferase/mannose-6-phosphate isomerase [Pseudomonadota bacterium]NOG58907.1 mannose-1-phosphate guanylyltransferase/mannose-6-phosphate isomerase [Pseudomonadota bacterium]